MQDLISRQAAIDAVNGLIDMFEQILRDIREANVDDSVCGMCEYDGAYIGQSGDWCNECPGFDKDDCFKLSDKTRKKWTEEIIKALTPIQPANNSEIPNSSDTISRQQAIDALDECYCGGEDSCGEPWVYKENAVEALQMIEPIPSAQPKTGRWILDRSGAYCCSECMEPCATYVMMKPRDKFCKMCGAKMEVTT